jgi:hypothetical protein
MMVRQDFNELPPKMYLTQVMDTTSKAYCFLWDRKDKKNMVTMTWKDLAIHYHKHTFKSALRKLNNKGLLSYDESLDGIAIELVGWDDIEG